MSDTARTLVVGLSWALFCAAGLLLADHWSWIRPTPLPAWLLSVILIG